MSVSTVSGYVTDKYPLAFSIGKVHLLLCFFLSPVCTDFYIFFIMSVMKILLFTSFSPPEIKIPKAISMSEVSIKQGIMKHSLIMIWIIN